MLNSIPHRFNSTIFQWLISILVIYVNLIISFIFSGTSSMIFMNKRRVMENFHQSVTKLWNEWQLRVLVLLSLFLQIVLIFLGNRRKYIPRNWLKFILWLAYSPADWIAAVSIGVLSNSRGDSEDNSSQQNDTIWAFWAPWRPGHHHSLFFGRQ